MCGKDLTGLGKPVRLKKWSVKHDGTERVVYTMSLSAKENSNQAGLVDNL
jgi:hypothetical protein